MKIDDISSELRELKLNAMKKINMERNRVEKIFNDIEKDIENFKKSHKDKLM